MELIPTIYEHAAALIDKTPWEVSRSADLLYDAHKKAYETYHHSPIVVGIDIYNVGAEAYGAVVDKPDGTTVPAITKACAPSIDHLLKWKYRSNTDRRKMILGTASRLRKDLPDTDIRVPVSGPVSLTGNLVGHENLITAMLTEPIVVSTVFRHIVKRQLYFIQMIHISGSGITLFDSGASPPLVSPDTFRSLIFPALDLLVSGARDITGKSPSLIIGGDTVHILDHLLELNPGFLICPAETNQKAFIEKMSARPDIPVRVNMNPSIVSRGTWKETKKEVDRIISLIDGRSGFSIGTGPVPYETPPENIHKIRKYIEGKTPEF